MRTRFQDLHDNFRMGVKNRSFIIVAVSMLLLSVGARAAIFAPLNCAFRRPVHSLRENPLNAPAVQSERPLKVLFIGNSYTYYNNLPRMVEQLAASSYPPRKLQAGLVAFGGAQLRDHWERGEAQKAIHAGDWDYVVLQEQSLLGSYSVNGVRRVNPDPQSFYHYARLFDQEIKRAGAKTVFFLTWARQNAPPRDQAALSYAYVQIAKELHALVAPVGIAWQAVRSENPEVNLYFGDGSHPSGAGSYLAACVFYALFYEKSPFGLTATIKGNPIDDRGVIDPWKNETLVSLPPTDSELIQRIAWQTYKKMAAAGGYPAAPRPPPLELPTVPAGRKPAIADLQGVWRGTIKVYPQPGKMELRLSRSGETWTAEAKISFGGKPDDIIPTITEFTVTDTGISFIDSQGPYGGIVKYQAAFTGKSLSGIAEIIVKDRPIYAIGAWELKRQR